MSQAPYKSTSKQGKKRLPKSVRIALVSVLIGLGLVTFYKLGPVFDGGKECIQNSQCQSGVCRPSAIGGPSGGSHFVWHGDPLFNQHGYLLGTCDDKKPESVEVIDGRKIPPGCSLPKPVLKDHPEEVDCLF